MYVKVSFVKLETTFIVCLFFKHKVTQASSCNYPIKLMNVGVDVDVGFVTMRITIPPAVKAV